jgi:hypothetical protein
MVTLKSPPTNRLASAEGRGKSVNRGEKLEG